MLITKSEIRPPTMTMANGQSEGSHEHGHHDGPEAQHGPFSGGILDGIAFGSELVDVLEHDYARLYRHTEQSKEPHTGRNAEVGVGDEQCDEPSQTSHGHVGQNEQRPLHRSEHGVQDDKDD